MENFHKMVTPLPPPPYCICEILNQIFTVNELIYNRIYELRTNTLWINTLWKNTLWKN